MSTKHTAIIAVSAIVISIGIGSFSLTSNSLSTSVVGATAGEFTDFIITDPFGLSAAPYNDIAVPGDYDGDGKNDLAVWRQSDFKWYIKKSSDGTTLTTTSWGSVNSPYFDVAVQGDYDGDGKTDPAVWRKSDNKWYILRSSTSIPTPTPTVTPSAVPTPVSYGTKAPFHRIPNLRAGKIQTATGWNVQDFALHLVNTSANELDVTWKLIADDPNFLFWDGSRGVWIFHAAMKAHGYQSLNVAGPESYPFAIPPSSNFTGATELSACIKNSNPCVPADFYTYLLAETPVKEGSDPNQLWWQSWDAWHDNIPVAWDSDLRAFVIPYTNYWHNVAAWPVGWHSKITIQNTGTAPATYQIQHIPDDYGQKATQPLSCGYQPYVTENTSIILAAGASMSQYLETLFGWPTDVASYMEGHVIITPSAGAEFSSTITSQTEPNTSGAGICSTFSGYGVALSLSSPVSGSTVSGAVPLMARVALDRGVPITSVNFYLDGQQIGTGNLSTALGYNSQLNWNSTAVSNGTHTLSVKAFINGTTQVGNTATSTITIANPVATPTPTPTPTPFCSVAGAVCTSNMDCCSISCSVKRGRFFGTCIGGGPTSTPTPTPTPTSTPIPTPSPTPTPTPIPTPVPTPTPVQCPTVCTSSFQCCSGQTCVKASGKITGTCR